MALAISPEDGALYKELAAMLGSVRHMGDWGPIMWAALHYMTFMSVPDQITPELRQQLTQFYQVHVPTMLPCSKCAYHFRWAALGRDPSAPAPDDFDAEANGVYPHTETKAKLIRWLVDVHNKVNKNTGKPELTAEEAIQEFGRPGDVASAIREATSPAGQAAAQSADGGGAAGIPVAIWVVIGMLALVIVVLVACMVFRSPPAPAARVPARGRLR